MIRQTSFFLQMSAFRKSAKQSISVDILANKDTHSLSLTFSNCFVQVMVAVESILETFGITLDMSQNSANPTNCLFLGGGWKLKNPEVAHMYTGRTRHKNSRQTKTQAQCRTSDSCKFTLCKSQHSHQSLVPPLLAPVLDPYITWYSNTSNNSKSQLSAPFLTCLLTSRANAGFVLQHIHLVLS